jgi:hypothetical protein
MMGCRIDRKGETSFTVSVGATTEPIGNRHRVQTAVNHRSGR